MGLWDPVGHVSPINVIQTKCNECTAALLTEAMDLNLAGCIPENVLSGLNMQLLKL